MKVKNETKSENKTNCDIDTQHNRVSRRSIKKADLAEGKEGQTDTHLHAD